METKKICVLVVMDPYETGEVRAVIGPFTEVSGADPKTIAKVARHNLLRKGAHPDHEFLLMELTTVADFLEGIKDSLDEGDEEVENPDPYGYGACECGEPQGSPNCVCEK